MTSICELPLSPSSVCLSKLCNFSLPSFLPKGCEAFTRPEYEKTTTQVLEHYIYLINTCCLPPSQTSSYLRKKRAGLHFLIRSNSDRRAFLSEAARALSQSRKLKQSERALLRRGFRIMSRYGNFIRNF